MSDPASQHQSEAQAERIDDLDLSCFDNLDVPDGNTECSDVTVAEMAGVTAILDRLCAANDDQALSQTEEVARHLAMLDDLDAVEIEPRSPRLAPFWTTPEWTARFGRAGAKAAPVARSRVIFAPKRPVTSDARDRRDACKMDLFEPKRAHASAPAAVITPSPSHPTASSPKPKSKKARADARDTRAPARWNDTGANMKCMFYNLALTDPVAWTLNLGPAHLKAANDNCKAWKRGMLRLLQKELGRDGVMSDLWFRLEVTRAGRLHLHGGLNKGNHDLRTIERALARAGGSGAGLNQADARVQFNAPGWSRYCQKDDARTRKAVSIKSLVSATQGLKSAARRLHEAARSEWLSP